MQLREDIIQGNGLMLIDPKGDLYNAILDFVAKMGYGKKVIIIDPNDDEYSVGINCLEYDEKIRSSTSHSSEVMKGIAKVFGGEKLETMPQLQRWERNAVLSLIEGKQTLAELGQFMRFAYVREVVLQEVVNTEVKEEWSSYNELTKSTKEMYAGAIFNRANKFAVGQNMRRIFGQQNSTIDFRKAMDEGKIILCNLARMKISQEEQQMLGVVLLDKITQAAHSRADIKIEAKRQPFYVYMDEFQNFVSKDIADALWELRAFNVRFVLIHQELGQIDDPKVLSAVLNEPQIRIVFRNGRENSEALMPEIFAGQLRGDKVKFDLKTKSQLSRETIRTVKSHTITTGDSFTEGTGDGETKDDMGELAFKSASDFDGWSFTNTETDSESVVPFLEPYTIEQLTSRQFYSIEEIKEKFIAWIQTQPNRHAQCKIGTNKTIPIIVRPVKEVKALSHQVKRVIAKSNEQYALPAQQVDMMLSARKQTFLEQAKDLNYIDILPEEVPVLKKKINDK